MLKGLGDLMIRLGLDSSKLDKGLNNAAKSLNNFKASATAGFNSLKSAIFSVQGAMIALGGSAVIGGLTNAVHAYMEAEAQVIKLGSALQSTGRYSELAMSQIKKSAEEISKLTAIDDDDIIGATATFAQFAKGLNAPQLAQAQKLIVGLSNTLKVDLRTAAVQAGKAINGSSETIGRSGIKIKDTKDQVERLNDALAKTAPMYAGAQAAATSLEGRQKAAQVAWGNLLETLGKVTVESLNLNGAYQVLTKGLEGLDGWIQANANTIIMFTKVIGALVTGVFKAANAVTVGMAGIITAIASGMTGTALKGLSIINNFLKTVIDTLNKTIALVNRIPGMNLKQVGALQIPTGGLKGMDNKLTNYTKQIFKESGALFGDIGNDFRNATNVKSFGKLPKFFGTATPVEGMDVGGGKEGASKKTSKEKTEAEKQMDKLKARAEQLKDSVKSIWEKEAEAIKEADAMLKKHLITQETYNRLIKKASDETKDAIKVEGVTEAVEKFFKPVNDNLEKIATEGSDAIKKAADNVNEWVKTNTDAAASYFDNTRTKAEEYAIELQKLKELHSSINPETSLPFLDDETFERAKKNLSDLTDESETNFDRIKGFLEDTANGFTDTFVNTLTTGKFNARQFFGEILQGLAKLVFQLTVTIPLMKQLTNIINTAKANVGGGGGGGILGGIFGKVLGGIGGSLFGGFSMVGSGEGLGGSYGGAFAEGGRPPRGKVSIVGEEGPEFFVPDSAGTIISNKDIASGLSGTNGDSFAIHQTFQIQANDTRGFKELLGRERPYIQRMALEGVQQAQNKRGRSGPLDKGRSR